MNILHKIVLLLVALVPFFVIFGIVFGLLKRNGKVYTEIIGDAKAKSIVPIIRGKIHIDESTIHTDGWRAYDGLVDIGYEKHYRVHHSSNEFASLDPFIKFIYCKNSINLISMCSYHNGYFCLLYS